MNKKLEFINPTYMVGGKNVTVRRGIKWAIYDGEVDILSSCSSQILAKAVITNTVVKKFIDITGDDIRFEHDPSCRHYDGLLSAMKRAYPTFNEHEIVTIVTFSVTSVIQI